MEVDQINPVQEEINKITLHNLKVDMRNTVKKIDILQQKRKHEDVIKEMVRVNQEFKRLTGEFLKKKGTTLQKVRGHTFVIPPIVTKPVRGSFSKVMGILDRKSVPTCLGYGKKGHVQQECRVRLHPSMFPSRVPLLTSTKVPKANNRFIALEEQVILAKTETMRF